MKTYQKAWREADQKIELEKESPEKKEAWKEGDQIRKQIELEKESPEQKDAQNKARRSTMPEKKEAKNKAQKVTSVSEENNRETRRMIRH